MGVVGVSLGDFLLMTPTEAEAVCRSYREAEEERLRGAWERSRLQAYSSVSPYLGKKGPKSPQKFLPLPWDGRKIRGKREKRKDVEAAHAENARVLRKFAAMQGRVCGG